MYKGHLMGQLHTGLVLKGWKDAMMSVRPASKVTRTRRGGDGKPLILFVSQSLHL